jgi:hypothetical protein
MTANDIVADVLLPLSEERIEEMEPSSPASPRPSLPRYGIEEAALAAQRNEAIDDAHPQRHR